MNDYLTVQQLAEKWGVSIRRINTLCNEGRLEGAMKFGNSWAIPKDVERPADGRVKSGKYIKRAE